MTTVMETRAEITVRGCRSIRVAGPFVSMVAATLLPVAQSA